ncbi:MAG: endonuclease [Paludibacteraceae bacterium]|nr:endonuclease [Paludibacteraceae bacterium]
MKRFFLLTSIFFFALSLFAKSVTPASSLPTYYKDINGKSGKLLFDAVQVVTKVGYSSLGYSGLWTAYRTTDVRDNGKIWDMYSDCSWTVGSDQCGGYSNECDCYNREHSIPKSWFGGSESGPGCDIFQVVPTDGYVNNRRSNYAFGEVSSASYTYDGAKLGSAKSITITGGNTIAGNTGASVSCSGTVFEPRDEYKGDFARGYFGTMIKWANGDYSAFTTGDGGKIFSTNYSTGAFGLTKYGVALLMKWHRQDPVSQKEIDRNNGIQQTQGNRNPFIDYPYLAEYIWGEKAGQTLDLSKLITAYDSRFVLGQSNGLLEGGSTVDPVEKCTVTWMVNGEVYTTGNPTLSVNKGGVVYQLPTAPKSCDEISTQFVGWSEDVITGTQDNVPADLFSTADDAPDITQNTTFHAVFAQLTEEEITVSTPSTIAINLTNTQGWTLSGLDKQSKYWKMVKNSYAESPSVDASKITSITINMRTWGGTQYNTIEFSVAGKKLGELKADNNNLKNYTWKPTTTPSGVGALRFSSPTSTADAGPAFSSITIETTGSGTGTTTTYSYSRYITSCDNGTTDVEETVVEKTNTKIIRNGQLLIEYNGVYYNTLGQPLTF